MMQILRNLKYGTIFRNGVHLFVRGPMDFVGKQLKPCIKCYTVPCQEPSMATYYRVDPDTLVEVIFEPKL